MNFAANDQIGKYRIIGELGRGGMGVVYLAEDVNLARQVSLKLLQGSLAQDGVFKEGFRREARLISRVVHPNVVQIHSLDEVDERLFIDMEYVEGQSLGQLMHDGPLSLPLASRIALDILQGLSVCHQAGVIHRDIKPSNILLSTAGQSKIVDFGIASALADSGAHALEQSESTMMFMGTPRYTPPEAWDERPADAGWDLYALGVMLHEVITGKVAYESKTMLSLMQEIVTKPLPSIEKKSEAISTEFAEAIDGMVNPHPERRFQSADDVAKLIRASQEAQSYRATDSPTITVAMPKKPVHYLEVEPVTFRSMIRASLIVVPLVLIVLGALWMSMTTDRSRSGGVSLGDNAEGVMGNLSVALGGLVAPEVWTAQQVGEEDARRWLLYSDGETAPGNLMYAFHDRGLAYMKVDQEGDVFAIDGSWAEYRSAAGVGFQSGAISGSGIQHQGAPGFTMTIRFDSDRDRSHREETYYVSASEDILDRQAYIMGIEGGAWLPALLAHEIQPRRLPLGKAFVRLFPSTPGQRVIAPSIGADEAPVLDGDLSDEIWSRRFFGDSGRLGELSAIDGNRSTMRVRHDGETLYVGIVVNVDPDLDAELALTIQQLVEKPLGNSARTKLQMARSGEPDIEHFVGQTESPLPEEWRVYQSSDGDEWFVELSVPVAEELRSRIVEGLMNSVRINCSVTTDDKTIAVWGHDVSTRVEHGALVVLDSPMGGQ